MKIFWPSVFQALIILVIVFCLIRLFPVVVRFAEAGAMGIREFWWIVLILVFGVYFIWYLKKRH